MKKNGLISIFNINTFSTPITDKIKPTIEVDDKKALEKDMKILKLDLERAMYEFKKQFETN